MIDFFTKQERIIIVFLLFGLLVGAGIKIFDVKLNSNEEHFQKISEGLDSIEIQIKKKANLIDSLFAADVKYFSKDSLLLANKRTNIEHSKVTETHTDKIKIDINSANIDDLIKLPQIGPVLAKRIVEYRNLHGPFRNINELQNVRGIGNKTLTSLKLNIVVNY